MAISFTNYLNRKDMRNDTTGSWKNLPVPHLLLWGLPQLPFDLKRGGYGQYHSFIGLWQEQLPNRWILINLERIRKKGWRQRPFYISIHKHPSCFILKKVWNQIRAKLKNCIDSLMKLIVLPLSVPGSERKTQLFEELSSLAENIPDEAQRDFVLSAIARATEKFIDRE